MDQVNALINSLPRRLERDQIMPIVSIATAVTILYSSYKLISNSKKRQDGLKKIPSPSGAYPYVGHMFSIGDEPSRKISEWHKEAGHIMKLKMGIQTWILIDDPILAHKIFVTHGVDSSHRSHATFLTIYSHHGRGVAFCPPEKPWKDARTAVTSIISQKYVDRHYMIPIKREAVDLTDRLIKYSERENGIDPLEHLHLNSMNIIFSSAFGKRFDSIENEEFRSVSATILKAIGLAGPEHDLSAYFPILSVVEYLSGKLKMMKNFIENERDPLYIKYIKEALTKEDNNLIKQLENYNLEEKDKVVIMSDLIGAGTDTVSVTLAWAFALLCNYPEAQTKAASEIDSFINLNGRLPALAERESLPYCISLLKEIMRLKPVTAFGIPHQANKDIFVDGYHIPKGATLITNMESIHQNPDVYPDPEVFYPERFANNLQLMDSASKGKIENRDHYGFGWGRRSCPGAYMAEAELFIAFVHVISKCRIEPIQDSNGNDVLPNVEHSVNTGLTLSPNPYKVKFIERANYVL